MIKLEHIVPDDWPGVERMRQALQSLVLDTGGKSVGIRFGTKTLSWPGATTGATSSAVTHGLGRTPIVALATPQGDPFGDGLVCWTGVPGATTFVLDARTFTSTPAAASTATFQWLVIG